MATLPTVERVTTSRRLSGLCASARGYAQSADAPSDCTPSSDDSGEDCKLSADEDEYCKLVSSATRQRLLARGCGEASRAAFPTRALRPPPGRPAATHGRGRRSRPCRGRALGVAAPSRRPVAP